MTALTSGQVRTLQFNLNERLHDHGRARIKVDGIDGPRTQQAVHLVKYLLGFPLVRLDTGASLWFRRVIQHPSIRPPQYRVRAALRAKHLRDEANGAAKAPAARGDEGVDWAWGTPNIAVLKSSGKVFACRYLSHDRSKILRLAQAQALAVNGISSVVVWEDGATNALRGYGQGARDAAVALAQAKACGIPGNAPIYFAVDFDATPAQQGTINSYFQGVHSVLGGRPVGVYGGYYVCKRLLATRLISFAWQTYAWSGGLWHRDAHLQQYSNGHTLAGVSCDYDRATSGSYGSWRPV